MTIYRKKPVEIEAVRWDGTVESASGLITWMLINGGTARYHDVQGAIEGLQAYEASHIAIDTLEGTVRASVGDFIIRGVQGEFYPCKPDIFAQTYEEAR